MEYPRLDRPQHLRRQPKQAHIRRAVTRGPVSVQLRLLGLREHVEAQPHVVLVGEAVHRRRVAVDRELERGLTWRSVYFRAEVLRSTTTRPSASRSRRLSVPTGSRSRISPVSWSTSAPRTAARRRPNFRRGSNCSGTPRACGAETEGRSSLARVEAANREYEEPTVHPILELARPCT